WWVGECAPRVGRDADPSPPLCAIGSRSASTRRSGRACSGSSRRPCGRWCCRSTVRTTSSLSPEATRLVDDEAELVDIGLDRDTVAGRDVGVPPVVGREALVATGGDVDGECLHV